MKLLLRVERAGEFATVRQSLSGQRRVAPESRLPMPERLSVTVLAAGKGTRMRNPLPKVLHPLAGRTLIGHVLACRGELAPAQSVVVLAPGMDEVAAEVRRSPLAAQGRRPGAAARDRPCAPGRPCPLLPREGTILVLYGDTPLIRAADAARARRRARGGGCRRGRARDAAARSGGLWPAALRRPGPGRDRRGAARRRRAEAQRHQQLGRDGAGRGPAAGPARGRPAAAREGRVLPHRHRGAGRGTGLARLCDRGPVGGRRRRQLAGPARPGHGPAPGPAPRPAAGGRRHHAGTGDGVPRRRHRGPARCRDRALCRVRPGGADRWPGP